MQEAKVQYTIEDIDKIEGTIITTEKDAVKLALLAKNNISIYFISVLSL